MTAPSELEGDLSEWRRLHPLSPVVRGGRAIIAVVLLAAVRFVSRDSDSSATITDAVIAGVVLIGGLISWLVTRWRVDGSDLQIETGLLRRDSQRYPLRQLQAIDVVASGVARTLGLAELRLRMAGGSSKGRLACLRHAEAVALRERLLDIGHGTATVASAQRPTDWTDPTTWRPPAVTERVPIAWVRVVAVPTYRLTASVLLSPLSAYLLLYLALLIAGMATGDGSGAVGSAVPILIGFGTVLYRRFNGRYGLTLRTSAHGIELRSGLVQTTTEVLPPGRIQAVRVIEPLLWRPFGWCRVEAVVAGKGNRNEDQAESRGRRQVLPVGTYAEAQRVLDLLLPDTRVRMTKPPARARWKALLSYHRLAVGANDRCLASCSGRLRRVSHWVPLDKVQSVRWTQGPVQRRLRLASVHLDTGGAKVFASLRDRDETEAAEELARLPAVCAAARAAAYRPAA